MNGQKMLIAFSYIDTKLIAESESSAAITMQASPRAKRPSSKRIWLIAAAVALMLLLVGCGVLYVLRLQDMKIGEETIFQTLPSDSPSESTTLDVISLQGIQGSPAYLAAQEWLAYTQSYTPSGGDYWESDPEYWAYSVQNQEMVDKLNAICEKYELKIIGKPWHEQIDCTPFLALLGIDSLLKPDTTEAALSIPAGRFFPGGSFTIYGTLTLSGAEYPFTYHCVKKDVFYDVFGYLEPSSVSQQNYTTSDGVDVLLLKSGSSGMILADREDQFLTLGIDGDAPLEQIAEFFDFTIHPNAPDATAADAREQASQAEMLSRMGDPNIGRRPTYAEYVQDLIRGDEMNRSEDYTPPVRTYAFCDLDGNGTEELLIFSDNLITSVVGMKDGVTDEGKNYGMYLCEDTVLVDEYPVPGLNEYWYHIFRFANDGDPVFSNPKGQSIVRLKQCADGTWWRTSSTDHYAEFDTEISGEEAMEILNSYKPVELQTKPLSEFEAP